MVVEDQKVVAVPGVALLTHLFYGCSMVGMVS